MASRPSGCTHFVHICTQYTDTSSSHNNCNIKKIQDRHVRPQTRTCHAPVTSIQVQVGCQTRMLSGARTGGHCADSDPVKDPMEVVAWEHAESLREHAGYQCLSCKQTFSTLFALGQHAGSPYLRGTLCGVSNSATELRNVPRAHLATGQAQAVPVYRSGTKGRSIIGNNEKNPHYYLLMRIGINA
jgi:hypothetical protein